MLPNPKLKLMDQLREVLRVKHYSIRTEQCYCDWIQRYVRFPCRIRVFQAFRLDIFRGPAKTPGACPRAGSGLGGL
jgi:hypothetical protein